MAHYFTAMTVKFCCLRIFRRFTLSFRILISLAATHNNHFYMHCAIIPYPHGTICNLTISTLAAYQLEVISISAAHVKWSVYMMPAKLQFY